MTGAGGIAINLRLEYPISNLEQQSRNQFCNHGTHGIHRKRLTTKHTNHTKKTIVNFLLCKNLTIDFVKNVQKKHEYDGLYYGISKADSIRNESAVAKLLPPSQRGYGVTRWRTRSELKTVGVHSFSVS